MLPDDFGVGYNLTELGYQSIVSRLDVAGELYRYIPKKSTGKKVEKKVRPIIRPPTHWMHDILASNVLIATLKEYNNQGDVEIIFENQIRKDYPFLKKIPDGLIIFETSYIWLELENIRKKGYDLLKLSETLVSFNDSKLPRLYDRECSDVLVAHNNKNRFSIHDIQNKLFESAVGSYSFSHLPF